MYLQRRNRILRHTPSIRLLVAENTLSPHNFIAPLFIIEGEDKMEEIPSMPGYYRLSTDRTITEVRHLYRLGIRSVLLFSKCADALKDNSGREAWNKNGLMQTAVKAIKSAVPEMVVMTDVALDAYSSYGHDGIVQNGYVVNDETVEALVRMSLSHAEAGADFVAPSDMMDGRVAVIRKAFEENNFHHTGILSYSAKYASCLYGPFRDALDSAPAFGDKRTYQMDYANREEAIKESIMDEEEGADMIMIKPAMPSLDIIREVKNNVHIPVCAYQVSGEYAMIKAAASAGWLNEHSAILECLTSIKRAGAGLITTYFAREAAMLLNE